MSYSYGYPFKSPEKIQDMKTNVMKNIAPAKALVSNLPEFFEEQSVRRREHHRQGEDNSA